MPAETVEDQIQQMENLKDQIQHRFDELMPVSRLDQSQPGEPQRKAWEKSRRELGDLASQLWLLVSNIRSGLPESSNRSYDEWQVHMTAMNMQTFVRSVWSSGVLTQEEEEFD